VPLEVPASAEIVLEGELYLDELHTEGLFGEFTGYYGTKEERPVIRINLISHRRDAICLGSYEGKPFHETNVLQGMPAEAVLMKQMGMPEVLDVYIPEGGCNLMAIAKIRKEFEGQGKWVGMNLMGDAAARQIKTFVVVDEDIDIRDWTEVMWAINTRVQPHRDIEVIKDITGCVLDPSIPYAERQYSSRSSKVLIDATMYDANEFEIPCTPHPDAITFVNTNWDKYGIDLSRNGE
jgi:4-hydroxy-3-polyprenylbenzoate decarboxylase